MSSQPKKWAVLPCRLKALERVSDGSGVAADFDVIEIDAGHDIALGKIKGFSVHDAKHPTGIALKISKSSSHPFASLELDSSEPRQVT